MYDAKEIAKWFLGNIDREAGESITHLKLQKLLYYAQAWTLVLIGPPLFRNPIQAWTHGPVVPDVYYEYNDKGWATIEQPDDATPRLDEKSEHVLKEILRVYGKFDAKYLEGLTHQELPWKETRGDLPLEAKCTKEISLETMRDFYTDMQNQ
jgi:uncharacterized phage-associated protein